MAVADKEWWNENLHRPAILNLTRIKSAATAVEDGTAQPALERSVRTAPGQGPRIASRDSPEASAEVPKIPLAMLAMQSGSCTRSGTPPPPSTPTGKKKWDWPKGQKEQDWWQ